jgi:hypothetical protein
LRLALAIFWKVCFRNADSLAFFRASIEAIAAALPASRTVVLPGQQHTAIDTVLELFVSEVLTFLAEPD